MAAAPEEAAPPAKKSSKVLIAVIIAVILVGASVAVYFVFLGGPAPAGPAAPAATFGTRVNLLQVSVDAGRASSPTGAIVSYAWSFGDGGTATGRTASHAYAQAGTYTINLTVTDEAGRSGSSEQRVSVDPTSTMSHRMYDFCQPTFQAYWAIRRGTYGDKIIRNEPPAVEEYPWGFDDPAIGNKNTALYCLYRLESHGVNVPNYSMSDPVFFPFMARFDALPSAFGSFDTTGGSLADLAAEDDVTVVVGPGDTLWLDASDIASHGAERVWSATMEIRYAADAGLPSGSCSVATNACIRWALDGRANDTVALRLASTGGASGYTFDWLTFSPAKVKSWADIGSLNITFTNPSTTASVYIDAIRITVFYETPPPATPEGRVDLDYLMTYATAASQADWASRGYIDTSGQDDGFITDWRGTLTMDYATSQRLFGVTGDPAAWWARANAVSLGQPAARSSAVETAWANWFEWNGNVKYDVFNGFEWFFQIFIFELNGTVVQSGGTNQTVVQFSVVSWGGETLLSRWFYWGSATYMADPGPDGVYNSTSTPSTDDIPTTPRGWYGQELGWMEDAFFNATIDTSFDYEWKGIMGYQLAAGADPGPDDQFGTGDDEAIWTWQPQLMDYVQDSGHPRGEMRYYVDKNMSYVHTTPGSYVYGQVFQWDNSFVRWHLRAGETLILEFPTGQMIWFDPVRSAWDPTAEGGKGAPGYVTFFAPATLKRVEPDVGHWSENAKTISFAGPLQFANDGQPASPTGSPLVVLKPAT